jgi:predicted nucleic acid-binding protein
MARAVACPADVVLSDERRARAVATRRGLKVVGGLGVRGEAQHTALLPPRTPILDDVITRAGFWGSGQWYARVLQAVGESQEDCLACQRTAGVRHHYARIVTCFSLSLTSM